MKRWMIVAGLWVATAPAVAQEAPSSDLLDDTVVSELVVKPPTPGPAWWRVSDADSAVYILIVPAQNLAREPWDKSLLERRLDGANRFILPFDLSLTNPRSIAGMGAVMAQAPKVLLARKPKGTKPEKGRPPLEQRLPPALRDKFVALRTRIGQPEARYASLQPWQAARMIEQDYRKWVGLSGEDFISSMAIVREVEAMARRRKVKVEPAWKIVIPPVKLKVVTTDAPTPEKADACLDRALDRMVAQAERQRRTYMAWRDGDVRPLLQPVRAELDRGCQPGVGAEANDSALKGTEEAFVRDQVRALERALQLPGRSVAILEPLSPIGTAEMGLLGRRGVLERLRQKGYTIAAPDVLGEEAEAGEE